MNQKTAKINLFEGVAFVAVINAGSFTTDRLFVVANANIMKFL